MVSAKPLISNQQQSPWLIRKNYTTMYWWPLGHIISLPCLFNTQWVSYGVLFKSLCIIVFCCSSDHSILGNLNSTAKSAHATSSALPPDVLSPRTARKSTNFRNAVTWTEYWLKLKLILNTKLIPQLFFSLQLQ